MWSISLAILALLPLVITTSVQSKPDFSGSWRLDLSRSDAAAHDPAGPVTVAIRQSPDQIYIATTTVKGTTDITYKVVADDTPPLASGPNARWQGDSLVTNAVRDVSGKSVAVQQSRRLSAEGNEMIVESIVNVQHGYSVTGAQTYGASTDVYVRVR